MHECICDFCDRASDYLVPINGGAWAICADCMRLEYEKLGCEEE